MAKRLTELKTERIKKLKRLKELGINPYPTSFAKKQDILTCRQSLGKKVQTAGRLLSLRGHGRILFADLQDQSGKIQLFFQEKVLNKDQFKLLKFVDIADFLGVSGQVIKTKAGEITIDVSSFKFLSKAIRPLPGAWHGLKDKEERFRKRYLDLLLDPEVRRRFQVRSDLVRYLRDFLHQKGYTEVETPTLQALYGGTNAKPFSTHLNALSTKMYLRIADELYLKRCVVGGFERVFEICKDFRNEGMDQNHSPEFSMLEFYEAYADYQKIIERTEALIKYCAQKIFGKEELTVKGKKITLSGSWPQITMTEAVKKYLHLDYEKTSQKELYRFGRSHKVELEATDPKGALLYKIFDRLVTEKLIQPTWVLDYPQEASPLAKAHPQKPGFAERFEGYIGGMELCDGWSEINDPADQLARFEADQATGKEDAHPVDQEFITALEHGMPPLGGIGIGIDRLSMFFTDCWSIREVILFPLMRPRKKIKK